MTNRIAEVRGKRGLSQEEFANRVGLHVIMLDRIEQGLVPISVELASMLADELDIALGELYPAAVDALEEFSDFLQVGKIEGDVIWRLYEAGLEADPNTYRLDIHLRGQVEPVTLAATPAALRDITMALDALDDDADVGFIAFNALHDRVAINPVSIDTLRFAAVDALSEIPPNPSKGLELRFFDRATTINYDVPPDKVPFPSNDEDEDAQLGSLFLALESGAYPDYIRIEDSDEGFVRINMINLSMIRVPLWVVEPNIYSADDPLLMPPWASRAH